MVRLIETHSEQLARGLLDRIQNSPYCETFLRNVPLEELRRRVQEIYHHLGDWLTRKSEGEIELRYIGIGERRASQGATLSELVFVIVATKEHLWEYVTRDVLTDPRPLELFQEVELLQLIETFFDRAIYFATIGYERYEAARVLVENA